MIKQDVKDENNELRDYVDDMVLKDKKEHSFVQSKTGEIILHQNCPDYKGRVGQAVIDLGITLRTHTEASLNKKTRVDDTIKVVENIQSLGLS
eukprot:6932646-Heterocapsa_arctica.AAC.1